MKPTIEYELSSVKMISCMSYQILDGKAQEGASLMGKPQGNAQLRFSEVSERGFCWSDAVNALDLTDVIVGFLV